MLQAKYSEFKSPALSWVGDFCLCVFRTFGIIYLLTISKIIINSMFLHTKKKIFATLFSFAIVLAFAAPVYALDSTDYGLDSTEFDIDVAQSDASEGYIKGVIADVINIALGFLGIVAVVIIIYAGFKWMTAAGNEEQVGSARKMIVEAVIGLVIVLLSWGIASFAIDSLGAAI